VFTTLVAGLRDCRDVTGEGDRDVYSGEDLHLARIGDEAAGWKYEIRWPGAASVGIQPTRVVVAVVRSGRTVMQVVWQGSSIGPGIDPAQFEVLLVRDATDRLVSGLPELTQGTAAATP
jgi:hypothetical protein